MLKSSSCIIRNLEDLSWYIFHFLKHCSLWNFNKPLKFLVLYQCVVKLPKFTKALYNSIICIPSPNYLIHTLWYISQSVFYGKSARYIGAFYPSYRVWHFPPYLWLEKIWDFYFITQYGQNYLISSYLL